MKLMVIDGNSIINRAFYGIRMLNAPDGTPTNAVFGFMQMLLKMIEDYHPDAIICAWDVHRPDWRMKLLEAYKAQRPPMDESLAVQFPIIRGLLEAMNIPVDMIMIIYGIDRLFDMGRTCLNITGDISCALCVTKWENKKAAQTAK